MALNYKRIGDFIREVDVRNVEGEATNLMGISINKIYIPSVANVNGTDLSKYKIISKGQFSCSLMQVSRDQRIPIALYTNDEPSIMSPAYVLFEISKPEEILPEYMELWFKRSEFDREACFLAIGGVRGSLEWNDFCDMRLPVPSIEEQRKIVHDYKVVTDRIELLKKINENLEVMVQTGFNATFIDFKTNDLKETKIGNVPVSFEVISFGEADYRIESGKRPSGGAVSEGYPSLGADCAKGLGCYSPDKLKFIPFDYKEKMTKGFVRGYELLLYKDGGTPSNFIPDFTIYGEGYPFEEFAVNEHVFILDFGSPASNWFAYFLFKSKYVFGELSALGSKSAVPGISQTDLEQLWIINPNSGIAKDFGQKHLPELKTILLNSKEILCLLELQNRLLSIIR